MRAFWAGLTSYAEDIRYSLFWIGLEALFGPQQSQGEITHKLAERIALFISGDPQEAREVFRTMKKCYKTRSVIVHGQFKPGPDVERLMLDTESTVRRVRERLLADPKMLRIFLSNTSEQLLDDWIFSSAGSPPPYPEIG